MAAATEVTLGTLAVLLRLEGRDFLNGLDKNSKKLQEFSKVAEERAKTIGKAVGIATGAIGAGVFALKGFAAQASTVQSMSKALGTTVERFQELKFVADQTNTSMEALQAGMTRLAQYAGQIASGQIGPAKAAFDALGISIKNASGQIKDSSTLFGEVADKFASFNDGAAKSALAVQLFGEQGVKLLPMLNQGSSGIDAMSKRARELGLVLDGEVIGKAAAVDKEIKVLTQQFQTAGVELTAQFLPAIKELAALISSSEFKNGVGALAKGIAFIIESLAKYNRTGTGNLIADLEKLGQTQKVKDGIAELTDTLNMFRTARDNAAAQGMPTAEIEASIEQVVAEIANLKDMLDAAEGSRQKLDEGLSNLGQGGGEDKKSDAPTIDPGAEAKRIAESTANLATYRQHQTQLLNDMLNMPTETIAAKIDAITEAYKRGSIGLYSYGQMQKQVADQSKQHMDDLLSMTSNVLTAVFQENKTAAIASSIINTYQGITKALASYPPPISYAMAAGVAAMGFAQVRAIKSQSKTGGGSTSMASGGSGGGSTGGDGGTTQASQTLFINGIRPGDLYTGTQVRELADALIQYQRDGGTIFLGAS